MLLVVIVYGIVKYRRKRNPSSVAALPTGADVIHNNAATIAAAKKEKSINEGNFNNPTYEQNIFPAPPQNDASVHDEVPH